MSGSVVEFSLQSFSIRKQALSSSRQHSCISPLQTVLQLLWTVCSGQATSIINTIYHLHYACYCILSKWVETSQAQKHWILTNTHTNNPEEQSKPKNQPNLTNQPKKTQTTKLPFYSFGQQLKASLDRPKEESKWGRELSPHDEVRIGTIIQIFHHLDQLSLPDYLCAAPFLFSSLFAYLRCIAF